MITWKLPERTEPGFLRRRREITGLLDLAPTPGNTEKLIDYLSQYVEDGDPLDMSQEEYSEAILVLMGYKENVSSPKEGKSAQQ